MDYPKSVPGVGLVGGRFVDEDPATGQVGSLIPSKWGNSVTQELLNVLARSGIAPDETLENQLAAAIFDKATFGSAVKGATAAPGTNTQQLATSAFVQAAIAPLAPLASPLLTGDPKAPTPAQFDNDTSIATTAFVKNLGIHANTFASYSASGNIPASDAGRAIQLASAVACTYTLPAASAVPNGAVLYFKNTGAAAATIQRTGTDAIAAGNNTVNSMALGSGDDVLYVSNGNNAWFAFSGSAQLQYSAVFSALLSNPGWRKLPSGEIEQWGTLGLAAVGNYNTQTIGGTTFYTHYYQVAYPIAFTSAVYEAEATPACATLAAQTSMAGKGVSLNLSGTGNPLTGMAVAFTTPNLGELPTIHWRSRGK